jgi:hypothetical protein
LQGGAGGVRRGSEGSRSGGHGLRFALTRPRPRVSYLSRHSLGIRTERNHRLKRGIYRFGDLGERRVEQEADGSWVKGTDAGAGLEEQSRRTASAVFPPESGQSVGRIERRPGTFPETNILRQPAKAGCACAPQVESICGLGMGKGRVQG